MILKRISKIVFPLGRKAVAATLASLTLTVLLATSVPAMLIVDTGTPTALGPGLFSNRWHYGQFTISQDSIITDVAGFIYAPYYAMWNEPVTISLSNDSSDMPETTLFSQEFIPSQELGWQGVSGVSWNIPAGTYWVGFEVQYPPSAFSGAMYVAPPNPLDKCGIMTQTHGWYDYTKSIGLRINGDPVSPAPLPGAFPLLGSGLAILWAWRKIFAA